MQVKWQDVNCATIGHRIQIFYRSKRSAFYYGEFLHVEFEFVLVQLRSIRARDYRNGPRELFRQLIEEWNSVVH